MERRALHPREHLHECVRRACEPVAGRRRGGGDCLPRPASSSMPRWTRRAKRTSAMRCGFALRDGRDLVVVQIAGLVARRIRCDTAPGGALQAGERFGLIRFGSRVDVYLPDGVAPLVIVGQRAVAGETVIADLVSGETQRRGATDDRTRTSSETAGSIDQPADPEHAHGDGPVRRPDIRALCLAGPLGTGGHRHRRGRRARRSRRPHRPPAERAEQVRRRAGLAVGLRQLRRGAGPAALSVAAGATEGCGLGADAGVRRLLRAAPGALQHEAGQHRPAGLDQPFLRRRPGAGGRRPGR